MNEIPATWRWSTVGEVADVTGGLTKNAGKRDASKIRVALVSVAAVHLRRIDPEAVGEVGLLDSDGERATLARGDLLIVEGNGSLGHIGRVALWNDEIPGARHQNHIIRVRPHDLSSRFVLEWLASPVGREVIVKEATSGAGLYTLSLSKVERLPIPVPPPNEQRRIVAKLESLQTRSRHAREALDAVPPLLEKLRRSILAAAFRGDLTKDWREKQRRAGVTLEPASELLKRIRAERRKKWEEGELAKMLAKGKRPANDKWKAKYKEPEPVDTTGLPRLPEGWGWAAWREVGFCQNGRGFPSPEYSDKGVKLLRPGNLHVSGRLEWRDDNTRRMPSKWEQEFPEFIVGGNELVMNLTAQSLKDEFLGRICLAGSGERCLLNQRIGRIMPVALPVQYWFWFFKSPAFRRYVDTLNTGSLIQHMFTSQIDACPVPALPLEEAQVLAELISARWAKIETTLTVINEQAAQIRTLDRVILAKAFRGELVPQNLDDESAKAMLGRLRGGVQPVRRGSAKAPCESMQGKREL